MRLAELCDRDPAGAFEALTLKRLGLDRDQVGQISQRCQAPSQFRAWQEQRRMAARAVPKMRAGRRGLPHFVVETMYRDYLELASLSKCGRLYGRTRQSMFSLFKAHGFELNQRRMHARILFGDRKWTPGKNGYYRATDGPREPLHHAIWKRVTGREIPDGWQVTFKNGDNTDFRRANLACAPIHEVSLMHYRRRFPARASMTRGQRDAFWRDHNRRYAADKAAAFVKLGLRTDGKPRRRKTQPKGNL